MKKKSSYIYEELIDCANGKLFGPGNAKLPFPPMLMFDRITEISENDGAYKKGLIKAELNIKNNLWFFKCHFKEDPVMPGCLGLLINMSIPFVNLPSPSPIGFTLDIF